MTIMDILTCVWIIIDVSCLAVVLASNFKNIFPSALQDIMVYGKTRQDDCNKSLHWSRAILLVPNRFFIHFYALGLIWNIFILVTFLLTVVKEDTSPWLLGTLQNRIAPSSAQIDCLSVLLTLSLLTIQLFRRLYESLLVSSFSGKMHLGHYALGILFYLLVNLTVIAEISPTLSKGWYKSCLNPSQQISWLHLLALLLFLWASYHQYQCHSILGSLTTWTCDGRKIYKIPYGDWFYYVSSPHYLAEIIIYVALFVAMKGQSFRWIFLLIFVVSNLTLAAQNTHLWYKQKFENFPKHRYIILPYVY